MGLPSPYGRFDRRRGQGKPSPYKFGCGSAVLRYPLWASASSRPGLIPLKARFGQAAEGTPHPTSSLGHLLPPEKERKLDSRPPRSVPGALGSDE